MTIDFDPGYGKNPWARLVREHPGAPTYAEADFRVEWGPVFHRGRLDGTAKILVIGQDPATHEAICRRILVGEAGQRVQGFLAKVGITTSYVMINTYLYSVVSQGGGERNIDDADIARYRNLWIDAIAKRNPLEAIITFGHLAKEAADQWAAATSTGTASTVPVIALKHPTYPDSASRARGPGHISKADAMKKLCDDWNLGLTQLRPIVTAEAPLAGGPYGAAIEPSDLVAIPDRDLPAGLPVWMRSLDEWAKRTGATRDAQRAQITVTIPEAARTWPPTGDGAVKAPARVPVPR